MARPEEHDVRNHTVVGRAVRPAALPRTVAHHAAARRILTACKRTLRRTLRCGRAFVRGRHGPVGRWPVASGRFAGPFGAAGRSSRGRHGPVGRWPVASGRFAGPFGAAGRSSRGRHGPVGRWPVASGRFAGPFGAAGRSSRGRDGPVGRWPVASGRFAGPFGAAGRSSRGRAVLWALLTACNRTLLLTLRVDWSFVRRPSFISCRRSNRSLRRSIFLCLLASLNFCRGSRCSPPGRQSAATGGRRATLRPASVRGMRRRLASGASRASSRLPESCRGRNISSRHPGASPGALERRQQLFAFGRAKRRRQTAGDDRPVRDSAAASVIGSNPFQLLHKRRPLDPQQVRGLVAVSSGAIERALDEVALDRGEVAGQIEPVVRESRRRGACRLRRAPESRGADPRRRSPAGRRSARRRARSHSRAAARCRATDKPSARASRPATCASAEFRRELVQEVLHEQSECRRGDRAAAAARSG